MGIGHFAVEGGEGVVVHDKGVHEGRGDFTAVPVAPESLLNHGAVGVLAEEEPIQLHVVSLRVHDHSIGLKVALEELREVGTMT